MERASALWLEHGTEDSEDSHARTHQRALFVLLNRQLDGTRARASHPLTRATCNFKAACAARSCIVGESLFTLAFQLPIERDEERISMKTTIPMIAWFEIRKDGEKYIGTLPDNCADTGAMDANGAIIKFPFEVVGLASREDSTSADEQLN